MARPNRIKFLDSGFIRILNSAGTRRAVNAAAYRIAHGAGGSVRVKQMQGGFGGGRPIAIVATHAKTPEEAERDREALESAANGA